jgi:sirohydrochlorin ferrochelatase
MFQQQSSSPQIFLVDNGSTRADATSALRRLASELSENTGVKVDAVSLRFADRIPASELNGEPAWILQDYLRMHLQSGQKNFILLPLFFGLSRAITSFVPEQKQVLESQFGSFDLEIADVLYPLPQGDIQLVEILHDNIMTTVAENQIKLNHVILVDHGSPSPHITEVRRHIALGLQQLLGPGIDLEQAVMERRDGPEFDFNGPLLKTLLLQLAQVGKKSAMVSMMFLLPGKHAGASGDIEQICADVQQQYPGFKVWITPLVSENPKLVSLLARRLEKHLE